MTPMMMNQMLKPAFVVLLLVGTGSVFSQDAAPKLPPPADGTVDFHRDIVPILRGSCLKCHSGEQAKGKLRLETRELLLKGGESGAVVVSGKSGESELVRLVAGLEKERVMPAQGPRLKEEQIGVLRAWIDQGLKWDAGFRFKSVQQMPLEPRKVKLPPHAEGLLSANPIDLLLRDYFQQNKVEFKEFASDRVFARRVFLDLVGQLPPPEFVEQFVAVKNDPLKRHKLVRQLLDDKQALRRPLADVLERPAPQRLQGHRLHRRRPQADHRLALQVAVREQAVRPVRPRAGQPGAEAPKASSRASSGAAWSTPARRPQMQAAQNISQVFMGVNLKCASCHDSFINHWKLTDAYGLAGVLRRRAAGDASLRQADRRDRVGRSSSIRELGAIDPQDRQSANGEAACARSDHEPEERPAARTIVNRLGAAHGPRARRAGR